VADKPTSAPSTFSLASGPPAAFACLEAFGLPGHAVERLRVQGIRIANASGATGDGPLSSSG